MKMPFRLLQKWPRAFGFEIYGKGPSYVISVEKGSLAYKSGLLPGDQLLEVGGQDVTTFSADEIKVLGKSIAKQPPELEVVSSLQTVIVQPDTRCGYGFAVLNERPMSVKSVEFGSPAFQTGLRTGDVILEAHCNSKAVTNILTNILSHKSGPLTLLIIPVSRSSNMVQVDKNLSRLTGSETRLHKAKDIHTKLEKDLGEDYRRKMAVVTALKQYAEDRDITVLCKALNTVLKSNESRNILKTVRLLIPPTHRIMFDKLTKLLPKDESLRTNDMTSLSSHSAFMKTKYERKLIQLIKHQSSFGFVIKSSHPAYIESVDKGGAADLAGLQVGDCIIKLNNIDVSKCDHDRLIQLLQESGSAPTLEVLRSLDYQQDGSIKSASSPSSSSSSHDSEEIILFDESVTDQDGHTFGEKANYLLTSQERYLMKKALKNYSTTRNIAQLFASLSSLLDTPSKKILWRFVMTQLPELHQEFILHRVDLFQTYSTEALQERKEQNIEIPGLPSSSQQQIDFLLTSSERNMFRNCLKDYELNNEITALLDVLETILDTPSKKMLWQHVIPMLTNIHREIIQDRFGFYNQQIEISDTDQEEKLQTDSSIDFQLFQDVDKTGEYEQTSFEENEESLSSWNTNYSRNENRSRSDMGTDYDAMLMQELGETKKAVQEIRDALVKQNKDSTITNIDDLKENNGKSFVTIIPVGLTDQELDMFSKMSSFTGVSNVTPLTSKNSDTPAAKKETTVGILSDSHINYSSDSGSDDEGDDTPTKKNSDIDLKVELNHLPDSSNQMHDKISSDTKPMKKMDFGLKSVRLGNQGWKNKETQHNSKSKQTVETLNKESITKPSVPPPPAPPPPVLSETNQGLDESVYKMSVKRINWEKLDNKNVQNTIWEKLPDHDLAEVINYLELETQFSTKPAQQKEKNNRKEVLIMDAKKAYNISILLGHLKMPVADIKKALYRADEQILSPGLLEQLLSFIPSQNEITKYKLYTGNTSLLTKPDQFIYQMSLVGNYEERLRGLIFKANFREKCHELKQNLENIKNAAIEVRSSEKLSRLLEIILAMGNYMNKGNNRIGEAAGFRITFLRQLDTTKTSDNKSSFLHVLADTVYNKFPEVLSLGEELSSVQKAAKISHEALVQDIQYLRKSLQDTAAFLNNIYQQTSEPEDCFKEVLSNFLREAAKEIEWIEEMHDKTMKEFNITVTFFGEDPNAMTSENLFVIFSQFIYDFELNMFFNNFILKNSRACKKWQKSNIKIHQAQNFFSIKATFFYRLKLKKL
ncbi:hypothetical protein Btru_029721 [Bulinus truncatus]|nr:hypothetical protein Btru_029721 [Bulinus truncatus]